MAPAKNLNRFLFLVFWFMCTKKLTSDAFQVSGDITMQNDRSAVKEMERGRYVNFTFDLTLDMSNDVTQLLILISGDTLVFANRSSGQDVRWTLNNTVDGQAFGCVTSDMAANVTVPESNYCPDQEGVLSSVEQWNGTKVKWALNITTKLKSGNWTLSGLFDMQIAESVVQGSLIRSVMALWIVEDDTAIRSRYLMSDYVIVPSAGVEVTAKSSLTQPILGMLTTDVKVNSSREAIGGVIGCLTPYENVSNEVMLTVQTMKVVTSETYGVHDNLTEVLEDILASMTSTIGSYQNNKAELELEKIPRHVESFSSMWITTDFTVRVEDYSQLQDGDTFPVLISVNFQKNFIWVGVMSVTLDAPDVRKPSLRTEMAQTKQCPYDGTITVSMTVLVHHDASSTATAYNVTVNVYMPPYVTMTSNTYSEPRENTITVVQNGATIRAEIARLTFSDPFLMTLQLDLDLDDPQALEASQRTIIAEAIYNDRWGNMTDLLTEAVYISLAVDKPCAKRIRWDNSGTCIEGACSCPSTQSPGRCAPCGEMWRCQIYVDEFSPRLGVITGQDSTSGYYYGIANNGVAHLVSTDYGMTWNPILDDEYTLVTSSDSFKWATFI